MPLSLLNVPPSARRSVWFFSQDTATVYRRPGLSDSGLSKTYLKAAGPATRRRSAASCSAKVMFSLSRAKSTNRNPRSRHSGNAKSSLSSSLSCRRHWEWMLYLYPIRPPNCCRQLFSRRQISVTPTSCPPDRRRSGSVVGQCWLGGHRVPAATAAGAHPPVPAVVVRDPPAQQHRPGYRPAL